MDKTLEIVMVVVALVISVVIVTGILQSQGNSFGDFANNQTGTASCGVSNSQFCSSLDSNGDPTSRSESIYDQNDGECGWASGGYGTAASNC